MEDLGDRQHEIGNFTLIYANHADSVIERHFKEHQLGKVSRAKIEMEILELVEKSSLPLSYRLAMYCMVTNTDFFELYWREKRSKYNLDEEATARLRPNYDQIFDIPPPFSRITSKRGPTAGNTKAHAPKPGAASPKPSKAKPKPSGPITPNHPDFEWEELNASKCEDPESTNSTYSESATEPTPSPDAAAIQKPTPAPPVVAVQKPPVTQPAGLTPAATPAPGATATNTDKETEASEPPPPTKKKRTYTKKRAAPTESEGNKSVDQPLMKRARKDSKTPSRGKAPSRGHTPSARGKAAGRGGKTATANKNLKPLPDIQEEKEKENEHKHIETGDKTSPEPEAPKTPKSPRSPTKKPRGTTATAAKGPRGGAAAAGRGKRGEKEGD